MTSKKTREYCKLKEEAVDSTVRRASFGRVYGPLVREATESFAYQYGGLLPQVLRLRLFVRRGGAVKHFIWL
jgi:hypothetical protein